MKAAGFGDDGVSRHGSSAAHDGEEGGGSNAVMTEHAGGDESAVVEKAGKGCAIGSAGEGGSLGAVVASLIGLELEGVCRTDVGFL